MKAVMYHYVRPSAPDMPHFPFLALQHFERQLDFFAQQGFVDRDSFERWVTGGQAPAGVLLTFDDGLRDHLQHVLPMLRSRGLFALFYVPSSPIMEEEILDVHKIHLALGRLGGTSALAWLAHRYPALAERAEQSAVGHYAAQNSDHDTKLVKYLLNWTLSVEERAEALQGLLLEAFDGKVPHWSEIYLTETDLRRMSQAGMGVGPHGHRHLILSQLAQAAREQEIGLSCELVRSAVGTLDWGYCYAHGTPESYCRETERTVQQAGCPFALAVEARDIELALHESSRYALPRHNCNAFPFGAASYGHA